MTDRSIPTQLVGTAKVLDEAGFKLLKEAIRDYEAKSVPVSA